MSTVRSIERRLLVRRETDRQLLATSQAPVPATHPIQWGSLWAGYCVFIGVSVLLVSLVAGIAFSNVNPFALSSWASMGTGVAIWSGIAFLIAAFCGSFFSSRVSVAGPIATETRGQRLLRGTALWGLIMFSLLVLSGEMASGVAGVAATAAPTVAGSVGGANTSLQSALTRNGIKLTPAQTSDISARLDAGDQAGASNALAQDAGIGTAQASSILSGVTPATGATSGTAGRLARRAATSGGTLSWGMFWLALLSLGACLVGAISTSGMRARLHFGAKARA